VATNQESSDNTIDAQERMDFGKNASRRQRYGGLIPAVLYGGAGKTIPLMVDPKRVEEILHSHSGANTLVGLTISGKAVPGKVLIKEHQVDPVTQRIIHSDFLRIAMDKALRVQVLVHATGIAKGVKLQGGIVDHPLREIEVEWLPEGVKLITDPGKPVVAVVAPTIEKAAEPGAAAVEAPTEPELIKKGKEAAEGAAPAEGGEKAGDKAAGKPEKGAKPEKGGKEK
jgi:large subunit ribosomal protein L25